MHCDWSVNAAKRWLCMATVKSGRYFVQPPQPVGDLQTLFVRLEEQALGSAILAGFDFPIGLPRAFAKRAGVEDFREAIVEFPAEFYTPASKPAEISLARPFYPQRPGGAFKSHLLDGLGLTSTSQLLRVCDGATSNRVAACELFWTLGAKQVGRAAISGWRDLLAPALKQGRIALWPFDGKFPELLSSGKIVVAEAYPAETYSHLGLDRGFGKRTQAGRQRQVNRIFDWCKSHEIELDQTLESDVRNGFGTHPSGDDLFDSLVGVLGLIEVLQRPSAFDVPNEPAIRLIEGWIVGMPK